MMYKKHIEQCTMIFGVLQGLLGEFWDLRCGLKELRRNLIEKCSDRETDRLSFKEVRIKRYKQTDRQSF